MPDQFDGITSAEAMKILETSNEGLTDEDAQKRLQSYGRNIVESRKENSLLKFLKKFWAPVPWMLELTAVITYLIGKDLDTYIILSLLLFNSFVSYFQESRADDAVEMLSNKIRVNARVERGGNWQQIPSEMLVPGDVIHVRMGDVVPADVKILSGETSADQSALTGESLPVRVGNDGRLFSGSVLKGGEATGVVVATGSRTFFGKTAELVKNAKSESHLEKLILGIVKYLAAIDTLLVVTLLLFSLLYGISLADAIPFSLVVLIASIPVALPATFTIATAYGAIDLSRKGALVTRLTAVEDAASMDTICFDKTGTLTQNSLTVSDPVPFGCEKAQLVKFAMLASDESSQDSIDLAILRYGKSSGVSTNQYSVMKFTPFEPSTKRTEAAVMKDGKETRVTKGAPQVILEMCSLADRNGVMAVVTDLSVKGFRTLGVAVDEGDGFRFKGIIPLHDPPRQDSSSLIQRMKELGIAAHMITGDSAPIALQISREVGIGERICKVSDVTSKSTPISECDAFAEVFPEDKFHIVKLLQESQHITGMTGDGVNDAPALKQAEVGIAVASATDVAKASASIVLTHEGLQDIVSAVEDGRKIFQRMLTYTLNKIIKTVQVAVFLTVSFLIFRFFATTPFDVILLLFANDFVTMAIATDNVRFSRNPEQWNVRSLIGSSVGIALFLTLESFIVLLLALRINLSQAEIHTFIFDMLVFTGQFNVYMVRERGRFWSSMPGRWLLLASIADIAVISLISWLGILVTPIPLLYVMLVLLIAFSGMSVMDFAKKGIFRHYGM